MWCWHDHSVCTPWRGICIWWSVRSHYFYQVLETQQHEKNFVASLFHLSTVLCFLVLFFFPTKGNVFSLFVMFFVLGLWFCMYRLLKRSWGGGVLTYGWSLKRSSEMCLRKEIHIARRRCYRYFKRDLRTLEPESSWEIIFRKSLLGRYEWKRTRLSPRHDFFLASYY